MGVVAMVVGVVVVVGVCMVVVVGMGVGVGVGAWRKESGGVGERSKFNKVEL